MRLIQLAPGELDLNRDFFRADFGDRTSDDRSFLNTLLEPLTAIERPGRSPVLVSGFRKFYAMVASGKCSVPVLVVSADLVFGRSNRSHLIACSQLSLPLWLRAGWLLALSKLSPVDHSPLEIAGMLGRASSALELPLRQAATFCPASASCLAVLSAAALPPALLRRLQRWHTDANKAALLARYSRPERPLAALLTCRLLHLSISRMRRFEELIRDIALREGRTVQQVLKEVKKELKNSRMSDSGQTENADLELFFQNLERIRSPERAAKLKQFDTAVAAICLVGGMTINPPPDFEGDTIDVLLRVGAETDLARYASVLAANPEAWRRLFNVLRTEENAIQGNSG